MEIGPAVLENTVKLKIEKLAELAPERLDSLMKRSLADVSEVTERVASILDDIRLNGDKANLDEHEKLRPGMAASEFRVTPEEIKEAYAKVDPKVVKHLKLAARNIRAFHDAQKERPQWQMEVAPGILAGRKTTPLDRVGCYIPGMRAAYPSTALMTVIPALAAGVPHVMACTPPDEGLIANSHTLVACDIAGVKEIYKLGGPWAIGSMAYGTETVPRAAKIVGPGNKYVLAAKMMVYGRVDIDNPAGPSEALILADATAEPKHIALDFLSQMEHDPDAAAVLITDDENLAQGVSDEIERIYPTLPRREILDQARRHAALLVTESMDRAVEFTNEYAAEHLQVMTAEPFLLLQRIRHAGSIFLGPWAPVPVGDYATGPNHVLPTAQAALSFSGLSTDDFVKKPTFQYLTKEGLEGIGSTVITLAEAEGLPIHAMTVKKRLSKD